MRYEDLTALEVLRKIVGKLSRDPVVVDELMQEGLVHLWLIEEQHPEQTDSWYLQSCRFQLSNYLSAGRSVDSHKRSSGRMSISISETECDLPAEWGSDFELLEEISARDMTDGLKERLCFQEKEILELLIAGYGVREIGCKLGLSHKTIIQRRRRIAAKAIQLGITPMPGVKPARRESDNRRQLL